MNFTLSIILPITLMLVGCASGYSKNQNTRELASTSSSEESVKFISCKINNLETLIIKPDDNKVYTRLKDRDNAVHNNIKITKICSDCWNFETNYDAYDYQGEIRPASLENSDIKSILTLKSKRFPKPAKFECTHGDDTQGMGR
jgi:hypothetical protein